MKRCIWKLTYIHPVFFKKRLLYKKLFQFKIRNSAIPAILVNSSISIYNGAWYLSKKITSDMVGLKLGEFSFTKRLVVSRGSKKRSRITKK